MHLTERAGGSGVLGPLPSHVSTQECRERDELARLIRALLENEDLARELDHARPEEIP